MARILVVEDDEELASEVVQALRALGHEVVGSAATAQECFSLAQSSAPDLVLMDVQIDGELDGIETAARLKKAADVPVVYLTGFFDDHTLSRARATQAHGYLVKPFRKGDLKSAVEIALFKHRMEAELARREHWFSSILRASGDAIIAVDVNANVTFVNPAAAKLRSKLNLSPVGCRFSEVFQLVHRYSREPVAAVEQALQQRSSVRLPPGVVLACGEADLPIEESISPIFDAGGELVGAVVVLRDIREREALHEQVAASERLASLGTLAAGIAHEINNPLTYIMANSAMAERELAGWAAANENDETVPQRRLRRDLSEIRDGAERIRRIVADLAIFARPDTGPSSGDVVSALHWALRVTSTLLKSRAEVELQIETVPQVQGDMTRLGQVFVNLLVNAAHAIKEGDPKHQSIVVSTALEGDRVVVAIRDSGCGMTPDVQRRIFEPFFTTKPVGTGTGLGLSVCKGIVDSMGGELTVKSQPRKGSTFCVHVPVATRTVSEIPRPEPVKLRGRILVVDDDEIVAKSIARMLEVNHQVEVATDARAALEKLNADPTYDVVVCDLLMPHLSGIDLYRQLAARHREQADRVVFVSGAFTSEASEFLAKVDNPRLPKPPSMRELEMCVQAVLRSKSSTSGFHRTASGALLSASGDGKA